MVHLTILNLENEENSYFSGKQERRSKEMGKHFWRPTSKISHKFDTMSVAIARTSRLNRKVLNRTAQHDG